MKRTYTVLYENGPNNLSAYVPDLPGCVGVGDTLKEVRENMREAITFHIELMVQLGESVPEPKTSLRSALDLHDEYLAEHPEALVETSPNPPQSPNWWPSIHHPKQFDSNTDTCSRKNYSLYPVVV